MRQRPSNRTAARDRARPRLWCALVAIAGLLLAVALLDAGASGMCLSSATADRGGDEIGRLLALTEDRTGNALPGNPMLLISLRWPLVLLALFGIVAVLVLRSSGGNNAWRAPVLLLVWAALSSVVAISERLNPKQSSSSPESSDHRID